jgi:hypothetical protein
MTEYQWSVSDIDAYISFCHVLGITDYTVPLHVWASESNNDPAAHDPNGNASGLFQLMPGTAKGLGYDVAGDPDLSQFRKMRVADQLELAVKYYAGGRQYLDDVAGFYAFTFLPAMAHLHDNPLAVLCGEAGPFSWAYEANKSFDVAAKGYITPKDLTDAADREYGPRAQGIATQVSQRVDTQPEIVT